MAESVRSRTSTRCRRAARVGLPVAVEVGRLVGRAALTLRQVTGRAAHPAAGHLALQVAHRAAAVAGLAAVPVGAGLRGGGVGRAVVADGVPGPEAGAADREARDDRARGDRPAARGEPAGEAVAPGAAGGSGLGVGAGSAGGVAGAGGSWLSFIWVPSCDVVGGERVQVDRRQPPIGPPWPPAGASPAVTVVAVPSTVTV